MSANRRPPARPVIDTDRFTRSEGSLSGEQLVARLSRLGELLFDDSGQVEWALAGGRRRRPEGGSVGRLQLAWRCTVRMSCVRCLDGVPVPLEGARDYRIALTETQAAREDADDDEFDVLAENPALDVLSLLEDELILALPLAPRHEVCALAGSIHPDDMA